MKSLALTFGFLLLFCQSSSADYILQFSPDASDTGRTVGVGESFSVNLYIAQTSPSSGLTNSGLFSFGTKTTFSNAIIQANPGSVAPVFNPLFSDMTVTAGQVDTFGALPSPTPTANVIQLATFNFTALVAGQTNIRFGDLDSGLDDFTLADATIDNPVPTNLDFDLFGPALTGTFVYQINVTSVPEPSSLVLISFIFTWFLGQRRRFGCH